MFESLVLMSVFLWHVLGMCEYTYSKGICSLCVACIMHDV